MTTRTISRRTAATGIAAAVAAAGVGARRARSQAASEVAYATFLDPNNARDPRAAAQTHMIEAFERANPDVKIKLLVDPTGQVTSRALRSRNETPDVLRATGYVVAEHVATGSLQPIDALVARDGVDTNDWLLPLATSRIGGTLWGLPQDYRIPILFYRKALLRGTALEPPRTWDEVCAASGRLNRGPVIGFAVPLGTSGGTGGAQGLGEFYLSSMLPGDGGQYFAPDGAIAFTEQSFLRAAQTVKDLYGRCGATARQSAQLGITEIHDGIRAGTIAMTTFGLFRFKTIQQQGPGEDLGWAPPPAYTAEGKQTVYGFQLLLNRRSRAPEPAWRFLKFMTGTEAQVIAARGGEVVARASAYRDAYFQTPEAADQLHWRSSSARAART